MSDLELMPLNQLIHLREKVLARIAELTGIEEEAPGQREHRDGEPIVHYEGGRR